MRNSADKWNEEASENEKTVGQKLLNFVMGKSTKPLTEEEKDLAIRMEENCKVKQGFLERIKNYAKSLADVKAILMVIKPVHFVSHIKFAISSTPEEKQVRLLEEAAKLFGVESIEETEVKKAA